MTENKELTIRKANAFVQQYKVSLSLAEIRIVNYLIASIRSPKYDKEFMKFKFNIKDFCEAVYPEKKIGNAYEWLPETIRKLSNKSAWKEVPSETNPGKSKKVLIRWIERPEFEEGYVTIELNPYLAPYLLQLESSYFQSKFQYTVEARSKYTIPLYEVLKSWEKVKGGKKRFEILELRAYMDALEKSKDNFSEFKRRALDPAIKEINTITDLYVEYTPIKEGRKVAFVEFLIIPKSEIPTNATENDKKLEAKKDFYFDDPDLDEFYEDEEDSEEAERRKRLDLFIDALPDILTLDEVDALQMAARKKVDPSDPNNDVDLQIYHLLTQKVLLLKASRKPVKKEYYFAWLKKAIDEDWQ